MSQQIAGFRLSPQQQHYLSLRQANPQFPHWSHCVLLCQGELKTQQLVKALNALVERHEILHTSFQSLDGMNVPLMVIEEVTPLPLKHWQAKGVSTDRTELHQFLKTWPSALPDLSSGACLQAILLPYHEQAFLVLALPALCTDAATWQQLSQELADLYGCEQLTLATEPMQYADLAEWQNELLESEETAAGRQYWERQSPAKSLKLPFAIQPSREVGFTPQCISRTLAPHIVAKVTQFVQNQGISTRSIYLATFQLLISRLTDAADFKLALILDGRKYAELEEVAGLIAKALPVQINLTAGQSFTHVLKDVESRTQELKQYQEYFSPGDSLPRISFEYTQWPTEIKTSELSLQPLLQASYLHPFELQLHCIQQGEALYLEWHNDLQQFTEQGIEQIAVLFEALLDVAIATPNQAVEHLTLPGLIPKHSSQTSPAPFPTVHDWFASQAALTPNQTALVDVAQQLTYQQLDERSNQLAHYLQSLGIGPEHRVIVYGDRNADLIIAIFSILKAGAAYVPVDAGVPAVALQQRIEIVEPTLILTLEQFCDGLRPVVDHRIPPNTPVFYLDQDIASLAEQPTTPPNTSATAENLAYIMFTSGSTGQPKGVGVEHRQLTNYIHGISERINSPKAGHWGLASTLAADLGHTILFPCLCHGHSLHILAPERCLDAVTFAEDIQDIDVLKIVPAHLRSLLAGSQPVLPHQQIILGGEALNWRLVDQIHALSPNCQILNHYGPTETTVGVLTHIEDDHPRDTLTMPLGRPLANTQAYVLDQELQPLPPGIAGTLYIGGQGVTRGYWQQPQLTATAFIPDPFSEQPGARLYCTGDRARYSYDGSIEFLGRQDLQVKVRGFRVEVAEIEAVLLNHEQIQEAAVVLTAHEQGHTQLVAYVVPQVWPGATSANLRLYLQNQLPEQMIPTQIAVVRTLPKLANGKCDRNTLATQPIASETQEFTAPRTKEEQTLAQLWSQVLGQDSISIHDNFFELGGDSILCIQMVGRATQLGLRFTPKQLFENPTIAELATVVETTVEITAEQGLVTGAVPFTPIQHWFLAQQNPDLHHWNQATFLQSDQPLVIQHLETSLDTVLTHHDGLRASYTLTSEGWQQEIRAASLKPILSVVELPDLPPEEHGPTLSDQASKIQASLDITKGPLIRAVLFKLGPQYPEYLLLVCHHLIIDGVSWRIFLEDLLRLYQQLQQGQPISLPPKTTSFQTWATRLQDYAQSSALRQELGYWLNPLPSPPLSQDFDQVDTDLSHQCTQACSLSAELTQALLNKAPATYQTQINDLLLTALVLTLGQWTGHSHLRLDLEGHGRQDIFSDLDVSRTIGWFTTLYPITFSLNTPDDLGASIQEVRTTLRQLPQQGLGFGLLRYLCADAQIHRQFQALPPAQVRFNYLGQTDPLLSETDTLAAAPFLPGRGHASSSRRMYLLDISGIVQSGQLMLQWRYSDRLYCSHTVERLAQNYLQQLETLIVHCQSPEATLDLLTPQLS
ncbi:Linear gramicidin synthase subunit B [Acaryochloris thomasi RCC1774]|uniref:Linear gramicidin synthase subunit B n=1 Tax=Acaryochloris thomasi RCC1774 TaxID=1764569 RepID=A0A2W1JMG3_9CYAN|nr:non-ribosomal peptide synthetase [Acaryochloris thomasi]PZD72645.1 Linear gramicidin synthase subunit B [Acaryochloris thomasi RCC1774]